MFDGRAPRAEYWYFVLFNLLIVVALMIVGPIISRDLTFLLISFYYLAILLPALGVTVRRLHDTNRSGWWFLITFVPLIGGLWLLVLLVLDSTPGSNMYGNNPKDIGMMTNSSATPSQPAVSTEATMSTPMSTENTSNNSMSS